MRVSRRQGSLQIPTESYFELELNLGSRQWGSASSASFVQWQIWDFLQLSQCVFDRRIECGYLEGKGATNSHGILFWAWAHLGSRWLVFRCPSSVEWEFADTLGFSQRVLVRCIVCGVIDVTVGRIANRISLEPTKNVGFSVVWLEMSVFQVSGFG